MMSLIDLDDEQRWVPTHLNVTVLRARGLRTKSKHGSRYLYTIVQVGKERYTTGLVDKAEVPQWGEESCFELLPGILEDGARSAFPPGSADLVLTVMHRVLIGLDVFLGQTIIPLDRIFQEGTCPRDEWFKLHSKVGRKEKERGELQVTVQFTRNNMTASMFDLTMKDKPRSAFGKLKDRVTGRKRGDLESSSAIVPGRYAALSAPTGQPFGGDTAGVVREAEVPEEKRSKMKDFFKGKLRKSSDTRSCSSLASDSSISSMASDNPPPSLDLMSDPPSSPIYTSKVRVEPHYGDTDLAKKVLTSQHTTKVMTHKRALSDEASRITPAAVPRSVESLKGQTMTQSKSSLCINGSHVYDSEPSIAKMSAALPSKLVLLEKCSPLSRSLQNITKKSEEKSMFSEGRRWSFDKTKKEDDQKEGQSSPPSQKSPVQAASATASPEKGRKFRKTLFSSGRSDSLPSKSDSPQATPTSEGRLRGWFGSSDSQNKPRLEVSPKVESSSDVPPPPPARSPVPPPLPLSPLEGTHTNPFTTPPSSSPSTTPLSPSNPFFPHLQRNPFFEELIDIQSPPFTPSSLSDTSPFHYTTVPSQVYASSSSNEAAIIASIKRDRPKPVPRQTSLPVLPKTSYPYVPSGPRSMSESAEEWEESFDVFASIRLSSPKRNSQTQSTSSNRCENGKIPPPLPPRRLLKTPVNEIFSDGWLHRGQELAVHKEAYLLSQTGAASPSGTGPTPTGLTSCTSEPPLVDAHHSLMPEETQPSSQSHPLSRTHPVKPLTSTQSEKKEGRSVLEMLKSTISPGRVAQQASAEAEKAPVAVDVSQYQDMTHMELISLLLQQEMDMQKQQAASELQATQLHKCEADLRKVKAQVRDLEDYIDNLLLRIMEQTPILLQVRTRHK
uniref:Rab11 family-interacting protein 5-like n=1 Tax=Knipowitschia caucasica TaxID=637954 RepID=A0AAV2MKE2_KNICA